ncbi:MAG: hypothetical protein N2312_01745 [Dictyoglomaceae bacterium]|nr:hypothetical protein [Dictyoglomaceae bacterium]
MPEKEKEDKKKIEQKREETKKPSLWSRIKKPLLTGVMAAGLLVTPMKKAEALYTEDVMDLPPQIIKTEINKLPLGWKYLVIANKMQQKGQNAEIFTNKAIEWFTAEYNRLKIEWENAKKTNSPQLEEIENQLLKSGIGLADSYYRHGLNLSEEEAEKYWLIALGKYKEMNAVRVTILGIDSEISVYKNLIQIAKKSKQKEKLIKYSSDLKLILKNYDSFFISNEKSRSLKEKIKEIINSIEN